VDEAVTLYPGERIDRLGYQGLRIIQNPAKFKFTIDAFLLAGFVTPGPGCRLIDLGTGGGVLPLLLAGQDRISDVWGLEIQPELAEMALRSVELNRLAARVTILRGDLRALPQEIKLNTFDYVIANPPFFSVKKGVIPENEALAKAKFELSCTLTEVVDAARRLVRGNGRVAMIYPAERLAELLAAFTRRSLTPKTICLIYPRPGENANLALVEARPGGKSGLAVLPPLFVYGPDQEYSEPMQRIFAGGKISFQKNC
jgi:tRNA1Val (adenine37-N6)-methyltransferase